MSKGSTNSQEEKTMGFLEILLASTSPRYAILDQVLQEEESETVAKAKVEARTAEIVDYISRSPREMMARGDFV
jgi:hypothetical protein